MDKFKKEFSIQKRRSERPQVKRVQPSPRVMTQAETEKFAEAFVRDYGETLVLLGKE